MKKFVMLAAAAAAFSAAPASAQTWQNQTYEDGFATYRLTASNASFCKFGSSGNATVNGPNSSAGGTINNGVNPGGDAAYVFDIQNDNDNTVQAADAAFDFARFVCNSPYTLSATSANGGLQSTQTTSDDDFAQNIPVYLGARLDTAEYAAVDFTPGNRSQRIGESTEARAGTARIFFGVRAMDKLVLQGTYQDTLTLTLAPNLGS